MKCKWCKHDNVCKYKETFITYDNMLTRDCEDNALYIECNFYEEIEVFEEPKVIKSQYQIVKQFGLSVMVFDSLEELTNECKKTLKSGIWYDCYELISYSDGKIYKKDLPF